jgi:hypothetical protein
MLLSATAQATVSFSGSGYNPETGNSGLSAQANFTVLGSQLILTLANTTRVTAVQGDALTGLVFNTDRKLGLELDSIRLSDGSHVWTSATSYNDTISLAESWTDQLADSSRLSASAGVATTGFNGVFKAKEIEQGNASPDYGSIGPGTLPNSSLGGARYPFIQNSLTFVFKLEDGEQSFLETDIHDVRFLFGTNGQGVIAASLVAEDSGNAFRESNDPRSIPAPTVLPLLGVALLARRGMKRWLPRLGRLS